MNYPILSLINSPSDLKKMNSSDMALLSDEIRKFLIERVSASGGHLASNLGVVEMTLAIHKVFDSPKDHIIFDVGHQSYVHKLLTGRRDAFDNLRVPGGLSGFTKMKESEHDAFGAGHSSTSVSASLGFAEADLLSGNDCYTVCVMGDGAFTGGMVHEALNNCRQDLPLIIILNENGMSISSNKGAFASYLSKVRVSKGYRKLKSDTLNILERIPLIGTPIKSLFSLGKRAIKTIIYRPNYFEELGLYYIGPIDGNDFDKVEKALSDAKETKQCCVVHLKTVKGKGYEPAEHSPDGYHSVAKSKGGDTFHSVFADKLIDMAAKDESILAVTAAMGLGTGLDHFGDKYPKRYFDVGIAESHALTFSAGLAAAGYKPYVAIYSTFLQRGYDSILHDIALQNLPVRIMIDRAGIAKCDGATHHGIFDVSFLSHIPKMTVLSPISYNSLNAMLDFTLDNSSSVAIRYPNAGERKESVSSFKYVKEDILCRVMADFDVKNPPRYVFVTYGNIVDKVLSAKNILKEKKIDAGIIVVETIKPYEGVCKLLCNILSKAEHVLYVEEGIRNGGAAEITRSKLCDMGFDFGRTRFDISAIEDNFASPDMLCDIFDYVGLSADKLAEKMIK